MSTSDKNLQKSKSNGIDIVSHHSKVDNENEEFQETAELIAKGAMKTSVYSRYIKAGGVYYIFVLALFNCFFVMSVAMFDLGLAAW